MRIRPLSVCLIFVCWIYAGAQTPRQVPPPYAVTSLRAMLFYDNTGTFSRDVAESESDVSTVPSILWNTPIEGASRDGAATSILVTVEVSGEFAAGPTRHIELVAKYKPLEGRRSTVFRRVAAISIRENGRYVAGFWLNNAGCNPVKLSARIVGQKKTARMDRIIRFGCGE